MHAVLVIVLHDNGHRRRIGATIGYLSGIIPEGKEPTLEAVKEAGWPADIHLIGKDILRFAAKSGRLLGRVLGQRLCSEG